MLFQGKVNFKHSTNDGSTTVRCDFKKGGPDTTVFLTAIMWTLDT